MMETNLEITSTVNVWQVVVADGNAVEFRQDIEFTVQTSVEYRRFRTDVYGIRHFDFLEFPIFYN